MHYEDEKWKEENVLKVVVYKHTIIGEEGYDYDLPSIQECKYILPYLLHKFLTAFNFMIAEALEPLTPEAYHLVTLKQVGYDKLVVESVTDVTDDPDEFMQLH